MLIVFAFSIAAGLLGSLLGLGGGIIVVPVLTLLLGVDIRYAIGASIVSVIATSSGAGAAYVREHLVNIRVAMFLELATVLGAVAGAFLAGAIPGRWLHLAFGGVLIYAALMMWRHDRKNGPRPPVDDSLAESLALHGSYTDHAGRETPYRVRHTGTGFALSGLAGMVSGLLGVGGGIIKVPTMNLIMGIPMKVASATSTFIIGVTAAASASVYFTRGDIDPFIAGPTAIGVLCGSFLGSSVMGRIRSSALRRTFTVVLLIIAFQMLRKGMIP
jgi:hypothetical protein